MTRETLDKLRNLGIDLGSEYDMLADTLEENRKNDNLNKKNVNNKDKNVQVIKVEGPFDKNNRVVKYVSKEQEYFYLATLNQIPNQENINNVKWAVSYDDEKADKSYYLFSRGIIENNKVKVSIQISENKERFTIYSYVGGIPNQKVCVQVYFKQAICFFIGGAGDKESFLGFGPSGIIRDEVYKYFDVKMGTKIKNIENDIKEYATTSYKSYYIGYNDAYKYKIQKEVIDKIPNKEGTSIYIIGHSLGGWNGAHLSQILTEKKYMVDMLITIDPVGEDAIINASSKIYWEKPKPKSNYWINIYSNSDDWGIDEIASSLGKQWIPKKSEPTIFHETKYSHGRAGKMFTETLDDFILCTSDFLFDNIRNYLNKQ